MIECALYIVVFAIVAVIVLLVLERVLALISGDLDARIFQLLRLLVALVVLLYALRCFGLFPRLP